MCGEQLLPKFHSVELMKWKFNQGGAVFAATAIAAIMERKSMENSHERNFSEKASELQMTNVICKKNLIKAKCIWIKNGPLLLCHKSAEPSIVRFYIEDVRKLVIRKQYFGVIKSYQVQTYLDCRCNIWLNNLLAIELLIPKCLLM